MKSGPKTQDPWLYICRKIRIVGKDRTVHFVDCQWDKERHFRVLSVVWCQEEDPNRSDLNCSLTTREVTVDWVSDWTPDFPHNGLSSQVENYSIGRLGQCNSGLTETWSLRTVINQCRPPLVNLWVGVPLIDVVGESTSWTLPLSSSIDDSPILPNHRRKPP